MDFRRRPLCSARPIFLFCARRYPGAIAEGFMTDVVILGAGGFARETCWVFLEDNEEKKKWNVLGFVDDNPNLHGTKLCDIPVLGGFDWLERNAGKDFQVICGVGNPRLRKTIAARASALGFDFCTVIHPNVRMSRWVELGAG